MKKPKLREVFLRLSSLPFDTPPFFKGKVSSRAKRLKGVRDLSPDSKDKSCTPTGMPMMSLKRFRGQEGFLCQGRAYFYRRSCPAWSFSLSEVGSLDERNQV